MAQLLGQGVSLLREMLVRHLGRALQNASKIYISLENYSLLKECWASLVVQQLKNLPAMQEMWV